MYKKSIFGQLFSFTVIIFLISFLVIGTIQYGFLGKYLTDRNKVELKAVANKLNKLTALYMQNETSLFREAYLLNLETISSSAGTFIFVMDKTGEVIATSAGNININVKSEFYQDVLNSKEMTYLGNLGGLFNTTVLTVAQPVIYNNTTIGCLFLNLPTPEIHQIRTDVIKIFLFSVCFVIVIALVFIYSASKRLTEPLKKLNQAAKSIASGDFERRVNLNVQNEIGELGETFNFMADSIEQLENMRRSFVTNVSHELRTPMTTIIGFIEGIMDGTIPPERHEQYLTIVLDESRRLSRLVSDLLDLGKMEQGKFQLDMREFDINEIIRLSVIKLEKRFMEKDIKLTINFQYELQKVMADKDSIQRVLTNLLDNAIKFTQQGGFIDIKTGITDNKVFVSVTNSGIGINENDLKHVFDRFYKTDKSRSLDKSGVGLGLYIVKSIIQNHNENIWVESKVNEFTRFSFTLKPVK